MKVVKPSFSFNSGSSTASSKANIEANSSFQSNGVREIPGEPELRYTQMDPLSVEIKYFQDKYFARNYNSPLTGLTDHVLVQVHPFVPP